MKCDRCGREFRDVFDTVVRIDYAEPGRGKPYEFHLCMDCRKEMVQWIESSAEKVKS
jgi:DNA-directed RNA polymerase subunit RPC12/RpoP